jgi:hypothetical protein
MHSLEIGGGGGSSKSDRTRAPERSLLSLHYNCGALRNGTCHLRNNDARTELATRLIILCIHDTQYE